MLLVEHHLHGVVGLGPLRFLLRDPLHPGFREETKQARLLVILNLVLHVPAEQDILSSEVLPVPQADLPAIMLKLDGSPPLGGDMRGVHPLLLVEPLLGLLKGRDLLLLGCHEVQLLEHLRQAPSEPFEDIFLRRGRIHVFIDGHPQSSSFSKKRSRLRGFPSYMGGLMSFRSSHTAASAALETMNAGREADRGSHRRPP